MLVVERGVAELLGVLRERDGVAALSATRRTSSAIRWGSQMGGSARGIMRPGYVPHHSSMCQSL